MRFSFREILLLFRSIRFSYRDPSSTGERGLDSQTAQGARPKETGHRSRLSTTVRNIENREDLDEEFVPSNKGFTRISQQPHVHVTPPQRRKIVPPRDWSSSSDDYSPPPLSSSRLRADFRDLSPECEAESRERYITSRT